MWTTTVTSAELRRLDGLLPTYEADRKPVDRASTVVAVAVDARAIQLAAPAAAPQFADVAGDAPLAPAARALGGLGVLGTVRSGEALRPAEPLGAAEAARWIARAHRVSDPARQRSAPALRDALERQVVGLLEETVQRDPGIKPEALTRAQFLRLLYLAAQTGAPRR